MSTATQKQTVYIQIVPEDDTYYHPDNFTPWTNSTDTEETIGLAVNKFLRESGYLSMVEQPIVWLSVFFYTEDTPRHPNGRPKTCQCYKLKCTPEEIGL